METLMRRKWSVWLNCLAVLALCVGNGTAWAQGSGSSDIHGRVTDPSGAVVPGAKISVRNVETSATREAEADAQGEFRVQLLQPGAYEVTASATGFATVKRKEIKLEVGASATVNFEMKVAAAEQVVTVTEEVSITEPERVEVSNTINQKAVNDLPINVRRWDNFMLLTPGVSPDGTFGLISSRGISGLLNNATVDGTDNNQAFFSEPRGRTRASGNFGQSAIKEFQVGLSTYSAEFGRSAGGTINAVTKSGSNDWHGEVFWFIRDDVLNAREPSLRDPNGNALKNTDRRQQYGLALGLPIVKNKLFYFGNWEQLLRNETYLSAASGTLFFSTFQTTCRGTAPSAQLITNCTATESFFRSIAVLNPRKSVNNAAIGKFDWIVSPNHNFTGSYNWHRWRSPNGIQTQQTLSRANSDNGFDGVKTDSLVFRLNSVITPHFVNEAKFQYGRDFEFQAPNSLDPRTTITNGVSFGMSEFLPRPAWPDERRYQWVDTMSWSVGRHTLKYGFDINYVRNETINIRNGGGVFAYTSLTGLAQDCPSGAIPLGCVRINTGATTTGKHWSTYTQAFDQRGNFGGELFLTTTDYNVFIQDTFKWTPRITINAGVRYEYQRLPKVNAVTVGGVSMLGYPGNSFSSETQSFNADTNNWGPRLAFAWDIGGNQRTVLRAGSGLYYGRTPNAITRSHLLENGVLLPTFNLSSSVATDLAAGPTYGNILPSAAGSSGTRVVNFLASDYVRPFVFMTDVAFEREITRNISVSATYVYTRGNHLTRAQDINLPAANSTANILFDADGLTTTTNDRTLLATVPFYTGPRPLFDTLPGVPAGTRLGVVARQVSDLNSTYHGFILQLTQRARFGLTQSAHLTISRAQDDGQAQGASPFSSTSDPFFDPHNRQGEFANSAFDMRKRFIWFFIWEPSKVWNTGAGAKGMILGGWAFNGILTAQDGQPFQPVISGSIAGGATSTGCPTTGTCATTTGSVNGSGGANRPGWLPRNYLITTGFFTYDSRVQKDIRVAEGKSIRFTWEAFNLFNRTNHSNTFTFSNIAYRVLASSTPSGAPSNTALPREVVLRLDSNFSTGNVIDGVTGQGDLSRCTFATCISAASGKLFGAREMQFGLKFIF